MMRTDSALIQRYTRSDRVNHWVVAITFVLAALSGLALFDPIFFWLTNLFGGGPWTRILHPYIGLLMFILFIGMALRFWSSNHLTAADRQWMKQWRDVIGKHEENLPQVGKYNAGQKYVFWILVITLPLLLLTGLIMWQPWFAPYFSIGLLRLATVVHALAAFCVIALIMVHIYAAIWVKGSVRAMTRGTVTAAWAKQHHAAWHNEISKGAK